MGKPYLILRHSVELKPEPALKKNGLYQIFKRDGENDRVTVIFDLNPVTFSYHKKEKLSNSRFINFIRQNKDNLISSFREVSILSDCKDLVQFEKKELNNIENETHRLKKKIKPRGKIIESLSQRGVRKLVFLVEYKGGVYVEKVAKPGYESYIKSELDAITRLQPLMKSIPEVIETGRNYTIFKKYHDSYDYMHHKIISLKQAKEIVEIIKSLYNHNYFFGDLHHGNFVIDDKEGIKLIDLEYMYEYDKKPDKFVEAYEFTGIPRSLKWYDGPRAGYNRNLKKVIGVNYQDLIYKKNIELHIKRIGMYLKIPIWLLKWYYHVTFKNREQ